MILIILFILLISIIMFNLLIAILSNIFQKIIERSNAEHTYIIYNNYEFKKFNKKWYFLILLPSPFNILNFILILFSFLNKKKVNFYFGRIVFLMYFMLWLLAFNVINFTLFCPLAYFKTFYYLIK